MKRILMILCLLPCLCWGDTFVAGKDYQVISAKASTKSGPVSVVEFFSYGCPWCFRLETEMNTWRSGFGNQISFSRVPVIFHQEWAIYAKAYYISSLLGKEALITPLLFNAIQKDKKTLKTDEAMITYLTALGLDKATLESGFLHSTTIDFKLKRGNAKMARYQISAVPALVINHQYKLDLQMAGSEKRFFEIASFLVRQVHQSQG